MSAGDHQGEKQRDAPAPEGVDETIDSGVAPLSKGSVEESPELPKSFGRYQVRGLLGKGGYGSVYLGYDPQLGRQVAVKAPRLDNTRPDVEETFLAEAQQLARLKHPGIVSVFDVGVEDGQCYIISAYLEGPDLSEWLRTHHPPWPQAVEIAASLAEALAHAHAHRTVHRDLKPANIIMTDAGPVIVDFGLSLSDSNRSRRDKGVVIGTPAYMAPEQARGEAHRIDGRTDIYSLGVILYRLLTRKVPFQSADTIELLRQVQEDEPQPPRQLAREIPPQLEEICLKALHKRYKRRYTTADDMADELRGVLRTIPGPGHPDAATLDHQVHVVETATADHPSPADATIGPDQSTVPSAREDSSQTSSGGRRSREIARRRVTVVQCGCDVFESESILETLDQDEQNELLVEFQEICGAIVQRQRGHVVQPTHQGLLACFGFPVSLEDATQRAVHAGLEIRAAVAELNERIRRQHDVELTATVAIHSDQAVVEEKEDSGVSLTGQVRSVVSQVELLTADSDVVLTDPTYQMVKGYFECEPLGARPIKGAGLVEVHRVVAARARGRIEAAELGGELTPLVGRDREVGLLEDRWAQAVEGIGQVVLLIGDAGLGKSRLVHVMKEHVRGRQIGGADPVIEWRTTPHHQSSSFYPIIDCFERTLGFDQQTSDLQRLDAIVEHLERLELDGDEEVALLAALLSVPLADRCPPLDLNPQLRKERTLGLLVDWIRQRAAEHSVLFVVEDLHWADPSTLEFLERLIDEQLDNDSILALFTFRPDFQTPWKSQAQQTSVALNRLTRKQISEMVAARSGIKRIPDAVIAQLIDRTDGVPLFIEEFTSMLVESARRDPDGNSELSRSFSIDDIPATLQDLLLARLDRMAGNVELVQLAAAIGREFRYELIAAVSELDEEELRAELQMLVDSDLLQQRGRQPRIRYTFKHALIQDAAYQSLVRKRRKRVHRQIADTLERHTAEPDRHPEVLAHHLTAAELPQRAVEYWERAGDRSLQRYAFLEAIEQLGRGLECIAKTPDTPARRQREMRMRIHLGVPLQSTRGYSAPEVRENYNRAHDLARESDEPQEIFPVLYGLFRYFMLQAQYARAMKLGHELLSLAERTEDPAMVVAANRALGAALVYQGRHAEALPHLQQVLAVKATAELRAESYLHDVVDPWITSRCYLTWASWMLGRPAEALEHSRRAIATAEELEHPFSVALAVSFSQWLHQFVGDVAATREAAERAIALSGEHNFAFWIGWGRVLRGWARAMEGETEDGIKEIEDGIAHWRAQGSQLGCHYYYFLLADACLAAGQNATAGDALTKAEQFADETGEAFYRSELHRLRSRLQQAEGDAQGAEASLRMALELAGKQDAKSLQLRAAVGLARLGVELGKADETRQMLARVVARFEADAVIEELQEARDLLNSQGS